MPNYFLKRLLALPAQANQQIRAWPGRGFTLIELLVVISIIGLLSSVVLASLSAARQKGALAGVILFTDNNYHKLGVNTLVALNFDEGSGERVPVDQTGNFTVSPAGTKVRHSAGGPNSSGYSFDNTNTTTGNDGAYFTFTTLGDTSLAYADQSGETISVWYNTLSASQQGGVLFAGTVNIVAGGTVSLAVRFYQPSGSVIMRCNMRGTADYTLPSVDNNWHNVTCVHDYGTNTVMQYFDGKKVPTVNTNTSINYQPAALNGSFYIGSGYFGLIDNLQVFSGSLTASEVGKLYAEGLKTHQFAANVK